MPRPKADIDLFHVEQLASIGCTMDEIATIVGCSSKTLQRRAQQAFQDGRHKMRASLRRKQYQIAMDDTHRAQATMLVWLGKQELGQKERREDEAQANNIYVIEKPPATPESSDEWFSRYGKPHPTQ